MNTKTIIFTGRSGCGKGTQAALLDAALKKFSPETPVVHLETGNLFRKFIHEDNYTRNLSKKIYEAGGLQPEFLTVHLWSDFFVDNMRENAHLIIDGTPRKATEAKILHTAFEFYGREKPHVIALDVSREWSEEKMLGRNREDDNKDDIEARLDWYEREVVPTIEFFRNNPFYEFHDVDGERTAEIVHEDIARMIGLK